MRGLKKMELGKITMDNIRKADTKTIKILIRICENELKNRGENKNILQSMRDLIK